MRVAHQRWPRLSQVVGSSRTALVFLSTTGRYAREALLRVREGEACLSFASFGAEIDMWELNRQLAKERRLALPCVVGKVRMCCVCVTVMVGEILRCARIYIPPRGRPVVDEPQTRERVEKEWRLALPCAVGKVRMCCVYLHA